MRNAIEKEAQLCWSSMFYETYPLVSEYCPGCGQHINVVRDEINRFPLLVGVDGPRKTLTPSAKEFFRILERH